MTEAETEARVLELRQVGGLSEVDARFMAAVEDGSLEGDVVDPGPEGSEEPS